MVIAWRYTGLFHKMVSIVYMVLWAISCGFFTSHKFRQNDKGLLDQNCFKEEPSLVQILFWFLWSTRISHAGLSRCGPRGGPGGAERQHGRNLEHALWAEWGQLCCRGKSWLPFLCHCHLPYFVRAFLYDVASVGGRLMIWNVNEVMQHELANLGAWEFANLRIGSPFDWWHSNSEITTGQRYPAWVRGDAVHQPLDGLSHAQELRRSQGGRLRHTERRQRGHGTGKNLAFSDIWLQYLYENQF